MPSAGEGSTVLDVGRRTGRREAAAATPPCASPSVVKVAMIVRNAVSHDARVLKEARSLTAAGCRVTIYGIGTSEKGSRSERRPDGVEVCWIAPVSPAVQRLVPRLLAYGRKALVPICLAVAAATHIIVASGYAAAAWLLVAYLTGFVLVYCRKKIGSLRRRPTLITKLYRHLVIRSWERGVLDQLRRAEPDVVHCHDVHTLHVGAEYKKKRNCRLVYDAHELPEHQYGLKWHQRLAAVWSQFRRAAMIDGFITVNEEIGRHLNGKYRRMPAATVVMNATLPLESPPEYDGRLHAAAGLAATQKILLFQGGLARGRGLAALVESAPLLPPGWTLVFMGAGAEEANLRRLTETIPGAKVRIRFLPMVPQSELAGWTSGASAGAIPYENTCLNHWYCSPNKLWEYPNAGVPVLASRFPVMERVVRGGGTGWLLEQPVTPRGIAEVVAGISDLELARKSENCRAFVRGDNWTRYERRLIDMYRTLVPMMSPSSCTRSARAA